MQDKLFELLMHKDEITWQTIIYDLVKTGEMDPWDIDISLLSQRYLETIKTLKEHNFFLSGKMLLASAILLRIKSDKLITEGIAALDYLMFPPEDELEEFEQKKQRIQLLENPRLTIKTPMARKRKVSVDDLIQALEKALEVNERRILKRAEAQKIPDGLVIPEKKIDISRLIKDVYSKILFLFKEKQKITFTELVGNSDKKEDKIRVFIPLLHLDNQEKINLEQKEHFGEIDITLFNQKV